MSLAHTSCTPASSLSTEEIYLNDIAVKQYDVSFSHGKCYDAASGGNTNGQSCFYGDAQCPVSHPHCQLLEIDSSANGPASSGALSDFPHTTVKPAGAMCVNTAGNGFANCRRPNDGAWNTASKCRTTTHPRRERPPTHSAARS